jgi:hypothetical protein
MKKKLAVKLMSNVLHFFQLYVDDFVESGHPDTSFDASGPTETPEVANLHIPVVADSMKMEMEDLRQQQLLKKQAMTALDQAKKSSEREQAALLQAQQSADLEKAATLEVTRAAQRENYMIDLMTNASQDMAGTLSFPKFSTRMNHVL